MSDQFYNMSGQILQWPDIVSGQFWNVILYTGCGRKILPGNIAFPMVKPTKHHRLELKKQVESGKLLLGSKVVETQHTNYKVDVTDTRNVIETSNSVYAHKIRLLEIRHKLQRKH